MDNINKKEKRIKTIRSIKKQLSYINICINRIEQKNKREEKKKRLSGITR
jgi:hypothetical protein